MNVRLVEGRISILFRSIENVAASDYAVFEQDLKILSERIKLLLVAFKLASELLKTSLHFFLVHRAKIAHFCRYSTLSDFRAPVCSRRSIINNDQNEIGSLWPARAAFAQPYSPLYTSFSISINSPRPVRLHRDHCFPVSPAYHLRGLTDRMASLIYRTIWCTVCSMDRSFSLPDLAIGSL